jgi:hypothetical protein
MRYSFDEQIRMRPPEIFRDNTTNIEPPDSGGSPEVTAWNYEASTCEVETAPRTSILRMIKYRDLAVYPTCRPASTLLSR